MPVDVDNDFKRKHAPLLIILIAAIPALLSTFVWGYLLHNEAQTRAEAVTHARITACESGNDTRILSLQYRVDQAAAERALVNGLAAQSDDPVDPGAQALIDVFNEDLLQALRRDVKAESPVDCEALVKTGERVLLPLPASITDKLE